MRFKILLIAICAYSVSKAQSVSDTLQLDEVVVSGTRFATPVEKSGKSIYKISADQIEKSSGKTVADLLNQVPGIHIDGNFGTPGTNLSYSLRGGRDKSVLVLIDGVPLNDPTAINAFYDLRLISLDQVASIEVLNGGLSSLYGSSASAGVISIKLKDANGQKPMQGSVGVDYGSYETFGQRAELSGKVADNLGYLLSVNHLSSDGISAAKDTEGVGFDKDGYEKESGLLKLNWKLDRFSLALHGAYNTFEADVDNGAFADNDSAQVEGSQLTIGLAPQYQYDHGKVRLNAAYTTNENDYRTAYPSSNKGRNLQMDLTDEHYFSDHLKGLFGVNLQRLSYRPDGEASSFGDNVFTILDPYASAVYDRSNLNIHTGIRLNTHSEYESKLIYNASVAYLFDFASFKLKTRAGISNAYITPSLYQLYSVYGNTDLTPEESLNYEAGLSLYFFDSKLAFNTVAYERYETDLIDFVSLFDDAGNYVGGQYQNVQNERFVKGVELELNWQINDIISASANYVTAKANKNTTFYRLPENKWGTTINIEPVKAMNFSLSYLKVGNRTDFDFITYSEVELKNYGVLDAYADYTFFDKLKLAVAANNITNEDFVGVYGFKTRGRNYNIRLSYAF